MKPILHLSFPKPKAAKWDHFTPVSVCGSQLKPSGNWQTLALLRAGVVCLLFLLINKQSFAQDTPANPKIETIQEPTNDVQKVSDPHTIRGIVKDNAGDPMPGVNVYLKNATVGTVTDASGRFEFPRQLMEGERLTFSFIGFESMEYVVSKSEEEVVELSMTLEVSIMGEVTVDKVYTTEPGIRRWWSGVKKLF